MDPPDFKELYAAKTTRTRTDDNNSSSRNDNDATNEPQRRRGQEPNPGGGSMIADRHDDDNMDEAQPPPMPMPKRAEMLKHFSTGSTGSILKVKADKQVDLSQSSLLAIEEARRYQQVEKGYKERKAQRLAAGLPPIDSGGGGSMISYSVSAAAEKAAENQVNYTVNGISSASMIKRQQQQYGGSGSGVAPPPVAAAGEWEFTAPSKSDGCCVIS